jgi:hypothetical protein
MKIRIFVAAGALVLLCTGLVWADAPDLEPMVRILDGSSPLKLSYDTVPCYVDWNNDGLTDLLMGEFTGGYITIFLNQGTNLNPVFDGGTKIESNGSPITVSYG